MEDNKARNEENDIDIKEYIQILWRGKWIILACIVIAGILGFIISSNAIPLYRAEAKILIAEQNIPSELFGQTEVQYSTSSKTNFETQIEVVKSRRFKEEVIRLLSLGMTPSQLEEKMNISSVGDTNIISISVYDTDARRAADIANTMAEVYIGWNEESYKSNLREILEEIEATLQEARTKLDDTSSRIAALEESGMPISESLRVELAIDSDLYLMLSEKYENLRIEEALGKSSAEIIEPAVVPGYSNQQNRNRTILISLLAGLAAGCLIVLLISFFDNKIKTSEDIKRYLGLEVISHIEYNRKNGQKKNELMILKDPRSITSETVKELRTNLEYFNVDRRIKRLCITSSQLQEGKSFVSANLAVAFAQSGIKTIVLDCDLRRPNIHRYFDGDNEKGITSIIAGSLDISEAIRETGVRGLQYIASGPIPPNPVEILQSKKMGSILESVSKDYQYVIIDTPPIINVADWMVMAKEVDAIILVAKSGALTRQVAIEVNDKIKLVKDKILGVVLNGIIRRGKYYYYRY
jgi:polysaccharide biosynthesis transport protein